jgi:hypothetical protein
VSDRELANGRLSIDDAVGLAGGETWGANSKQWCPFGHINHIDGGVGKAFRVYPDSNTAYCFAGCGWFDPTHMVAVAKDMTDRDAALWILEYTGYREPTVESRWEAATAVHTVVDTAALAEALKVFCTRLDPMWDVHRFDEPFASTFRKCLALLDRVTTEDEAAKWLAVTKDGMRSLLSR